MLIKSLLIYAIFNKIQVRSDMQDRVNVIELDEDPDLCEEHSLHLEFIDIENAHLNILSLAFVTYN